MKNLIIISAPSGSGKTTVCRALQKRDPQVHFSVSFTTRAKRSNEIEGVDYYFIENDEFKIRIENNEFAEWEKIHGNFYYGTLANTLIRTIAEKKILLLELDVKGAMSIKKLYPDNTLTIFVVPPSMEELRTRLRNRGADSEERIAKRLARLIDEMDYKKYFDHSVVNLKVDDAVAEIFEILTKENKGLYHGIGNIINS
ncbi:MAG: guanylate kinase [Candidatus Neomarinimicrobiota bacterium]